MRLMRASMRCKHKTISNNRCVGCGMDVTRPIPPPATADAAQDEDEPAQHTNDCLTEDASVIECPKCAAIAINRLSFALREARAEVARLRERYEALKRDNAITRRELVAAKDNEQKYFKDSCHLAALLAAAEEMRLRLAMIPGGLRWSELNRYDAAIAAAKEQRDE